MNFFKKIVLMVSFCIAQSALSSSMKQNQSPTPNVDFFGLKKIVATTDGGLNKYKAYVYIDNVLSSGHFSLIAGSGMFANVLHANATKMTEQQRGKLYDYIGNYVCLVVQIDKHKIIYIIDFVSGKCT